VTELRGDHDFVATSPQSLAEELLADPVRPVFVRSVKEVDTGIKSLTDDVGALRRVAILTELIAAQPDDRYP